MKRLWSMTALLACTGGGVTQSIDLSHLDDVDEDGHPVETDCDDNNASVYPGADEICDGLDNDCDGFIDTADEDAVGLLTGYTDADGDGYGAMDAELSDCELPESSVEIGGDCDDADASVHPGASESCSTTADDDCSGTVNDPDALGCSDWFIDDDGDGHGSGEALCLCFGEGSYSSASDADCDDTDPDTHPDAIEICDDGWDHDCDESAEACRLTDSYDIEDAPLYLQGTEAGAQLGLHLALADDLSGDGYSDLLVHGLSTEALLWVVEASGHGDVPLSPSNTLQPSAGLTSIDSAWGADLSGDGVADLVVGSEAEGGDAGTVAIFLGPLPESFDLSSAWKIWTGEPGDRIGETAWLGDLRRLLFREFSWP